MDFWTPPRFLKNKTRNAAIQAKPDTSQHCYNSDDNRTTTTTTKNKNKKRNHKNKKNKNKHNQQQQQGGAIAFKQSHYLGPAKTYILRGTPRTYAIRTRAVTDN